MVDGRTDTDGHNQPRASARGGSSPWGRSGAEEACQRLDTPLAEAIRARSREPSDEYRPRTAGKQFDAGYSDDGGGAGSSGSRLISAFSSLPGLK